MDKIKRIPPPPCWKDGMDCPNRSSECHATCKEYNDWAALRDEYREAIRKIKTTINTTNAYFVDGALERRKRRS